MRRRTVLAERPVRWANSVGERKHLRISCLDSVDILAANSLYLMPTHH